MFERRRVPESVEFGSDGKPTASLTEQLHSGESARTGLAIAAPSLVSNG
jgi:hypothetical protein